MTESKAQTLSARGIRLHHTLRGHLGLVHCVAWSPDGVNIASCSEDSTVRIWGLEKEDSQKSFSHGRGVTSLAWSPDGRMLAAVLSDGALWLRDLRTDQSRQLPTGPARSLPVPLDHDRTTHRTGEIRHSPDTSAPGARPPASDRAASHLLVSAAARAFLFATA